MGLAVTVIFTVTSRDRSARPGKTTEISVTDQAVLMLLRLVTHTHSRRKH